MQEQVEHLMIHDHTLLIAFQGKVGAALSLSKLHSCIKLEEKKLYCDVPNQDWPSSADAFPPRTMGQNYWSRHIPQLNASCQDVSLTKTAAQPVYLVS